MMATGAAVKDAVTITYDLPFIRADEEFVRNLIARCDEIRLETHAGYPSIWELRDGLVIWADVDHDSGPRLTIQELHQFIEENLQLILDEIDGDFQISLKFKENARKSLLNN
jgi:hypothetical protein